MCYIDNVINFEVWNEADYDMAKDDPNVLKAFIEVEAVHNAITAHGIDLSKPLVQCEVTPDSKESEERLEAHGICIEDSVLPEHFVDMQLIHKNLVHDNFCLGDVYLGSIKGVKVVAHIWDFTGLAIYTNSTK